MERKMMMMVDDGDTEEDDIEGSDEEYINESELFKLYSFQL
jgi:hypothetical protein